MGHDAHLDLEIITANLTGETTPSSPTLEALTDWNDFNTLQWNAERGTGALPSHTVNGVSIHPRANEETFPEAGQPGNVTRYRRCWYDSEDEEKGYLGDITRYPGNEAEVNDLIVVEQWQTTHNDASDVVLNTH